MKSSSYNLSTFGPNRTKSSSVTLVTHFAKSGLITGGKKKGDVDVEYIRKDTLLEWVNLEKDKTSIGLSEYDAGHENARMELLNDLIDKINGL